MPRVKLDMSLYIGELEKEFLRKVQERLEMLEKKFSEERELREALEDFSLYSVNAASDC